MSHVYKRGKRWYGSWKAHDGRRVRGVIPEARTKRQNGA